MNRILKTGLLALAGAVLASQNAAAQYADGDLVLGVRLQNNTGNNYEVDLGNFGNYDNLDGSFFTLPSVSTADLSSIFGVGWTGGTSGGQNLRWGIGAVDNTGFALFLSEGRLNPAVQTTAFNNVTVGSFNNGSANIGNVGSLISGTTLTVGAADPNSYSSRVKTAGNYQVTLGGGSSSSIENGLNVASASVVSDLYEVLPTTSGKATYLGFFTFSSSGLSFQSATVPEPGAAALMGAGFLALFFRQHIRRKHA